MRRSATHALLASLAALVAVPALGQQTLIDLPLENANSYGAVQRPGGGTVAVGHLADTVNNATVIALNAQGGLDWSRTLTPMEGEDIYDRWSISSILPDHDGGVLLSGYASPRSQDDVQQDEDTTSVRHAFSVLSDQGELGSSWMVQREVVGLWPASTDAQVVATIPAGGSYLLLDYMSPDNTLELVKLSAAGDLMWARSIGTPAEPGGEFPTLADFQMSFNLYSMRVLSSSSGDAYIINLVAEPWQCLMVKKIDPDGSLVWSKNYCFTNAPEGAVLHDAVIGGDGNIHALARYGPIGSDVHLAMEIDPEGTLTAVDALDIPAYGDYFLLGEQDGHRWLVPQNAERIMHLVPDGTIETTVYPPQVETPYTRSTELLAAGSFDGTVRMTSRMTKQHNIFMTTVRYPVIWSLPGDDLDVCGSFSFDSEYVPMPLEYFSVTDDPEEVSIDVTNRVSSTPALLYMAADPLLSAFDPCEFSVGHANVAEPAHTLAPNVLFSGGSVDVWSAEVANIQLLGLDGRVMMNTSIIAGSRRIPLTCTAGTYLLRATNMDGIPLWCEKLTVQ